MFNPPRAIAAASLRGEYSQNSFNLKDEELPAPKYNYFDVIPRVSLIYNRSQAMRYTLTYNTSLGNDDLSTGVN